MNNDFVRASVAVHHKGPVRVSARSSVTTDGALYYSVTLGSWGDAAPEVTLFLAEGDPLWGVLNAYAHGAKND